MRTANHTIEKRGYADINSKRVGGREEGAWLEELSLQTVGQVTRARTICCLVALRRRLENPGVAGSRGREGGDRAEAKAILPKMPTSAPASYTAPHRPPSF